MRARTSAGQTFASTSLTRAVVISVSVAAARSYPSGEAFDYPYLPHRFTRINHPWTNGQVERMNRTIKDATVKRYHYDSRDQLERDLYDFVSAYNFDRRLKTLKGLTSCESICKRRALEPKFFTPYLIHQMPGLNT
jgi:hypothetical protein